MLSVGNEGDERRISGLGLGYRGRRGMEENELEEGEAVSSLEYDPDASLSYIDEKIREVLGHYQKDFEGEVSAESSGAKLGEYGSFLPVYLRLPSVWPQQSRVPGRPSLSSSQNLHLENRKASTSPPVLTENNPTPVAQQLDDAMRKNEQNLGTDKINNKGNDNNLLKVRIKVGSGNVLLRPLAAIYSDMGLDYSPSSSPEGSPGTSGGISSAASPVDSPMVAFQVMTSFEVPGGRLLSPLPASLLQLVESEGWYSKSQKSSMLGVSKSKQSTEKGKLSVRKKGKNFKVNLRSKPEIEIQVGCSVKSNSSVSCDKSRRTDQPKKEKASLPDFSDNELREVVASSDARKPSDAGDHFFDLKIKKLKEVKLHKQKVDQHGTHIKGTSTSSSKSLNGEYDKMAPPMADDRLFLSIDSSFHEERETNLREPGMKNPKKSIEALTSVENKKKPHYKGDHSVKRQNAVRSLQELNKNLSKESNRNSPRESKAVNEIKANEKISSEFSEKANDYQKTNKGDYSAPSNMLKNDTESFPVMENNTSSGDAAVAPLSHVVIEDNWVCCDKCQQWRLLPYGMDPLQLPKKWLCSMLYWLPGMNKCSISEEETTRALHAAYQAPLTENQNFLNDHATIQSAPGAISVNGQNLNRGQSQAELQQAGDYPKKNSSLKEFSNHVGRDHVESITFRENQANGLNKYHFEQRNKSAEENFDKVKEKKSKKHRTVERCSTEGGVIGQKGHILKTKSKRVSGQEDPRVSKKLKSEDALHANEDWNSLNGKSASKMGIGIVSKSLNFPSPKDAKIASHEVEGLTKKFKFNEKLSSNEGSKENSSKKRIEEEMRSGPCKEKKAKISKTEEMATFKRKMDDEIVERDRGISCAHKIMETMKRPIVDKDQKNQCHGFVESENHMNCLESKRAHYDVHTCTAANSSSSKVSSSCKNKSTFHDVDGSPVESVSSSPLRILNTRGSDAYESQKRCSNEEGFDGIDQSFTPNIGKPSSFAQNGSSKDYQDTTLEAASTFKIKSKDKTQLQLSCGKEKDKYKENKTIIGNSLNQVKPSTGSLLRAKEKHKSSNSSIEKCKDKISNSVDSYRRKNNSRHDSDSDLREGNYRSSENKDAQGPSDFKLKKSQAPEILGPSERDPRSSKTNKSSQFEYSSKSPYEDKRLSKSDLLSNVMKNSVDNDAMHCEDKGKLPEQPKNPIIQNAKHQNYSTASVLKEARDLKHTANRLKAEGLEQQSTALYFEAALKFLHVAFLLELSSTDIGKHGESTQSMSMYSDTAKLCEFCALEYERLREMAAAALAYKCMEVAYMKVVYSKHSNASKDRHELQTALHIVSSGDSPSSSASDIDNLNNQSTINKSSVTKAVNPPQMAGSLTIAARNRPAYARLLDFAHDVNFAMEASRKSQNAFSAASTCQEELNYVPEGLASVKRVLDLSFHDVEGLLRLVRQSMDSISR